MQRVQSLLRPQKNPPAIGTTQDIMAMASQAWEFSYCELWRRTKLNSGFELLTLDPDTCCVSPMQQSPGVALFRNVSKSYVFRHGQGIPGRVWSSGQYELQANVQELEEQVFLRRKFAPIAGLFGAVGQAITDPVCGEVLGVLCAFLNAPLTS